jgi:hypothetical protein
MKLTPTSYRKYVASMADSSKDPAMEKANIALKKIFNNQTVVGALHRWFTCSI